MPNLSTHLLFAEQGKILSAKHDYYVQNKEKCQVFVMSIIYEIRKNMQKTPFDGKPIIATTLTKYKQIVVSESAITYIVNFAHGK